MEKVQEVQKVQPVSTKKGKWTTICRSALTGQNAIEDLRKAEPNDEQIQQVCNAFALIMATAMERRQALL
jgi:hypothetical protein